MSIRTAGIMSTATMVGMRFWPALSGEPALLLGKRLSPAEAQSVERRRAWRGVTRFRAGFCSPSELSSVKWPMLTLAKGLIGGLQG